MAILDADKEGFLRSETSLIQTIGRAARNAEGHVIMYADTITDSMRTAIDETSEDEKFRWLTMKNMALRRRQSRRRPGSDQYLQEVAAEELKLEKDPESMSRKELEKLIEELRSRCRKPLQSWILKQRPC